MRRMTSIFNWMIILLTLAKYAHGAKGPDPYNSTNARLMNDLLRRYQKHIRPVAHPSDTITVSIYGAPYQIINVDQKRNLISISAHFVMDWQDSFLQWDPKDYENADHVLLPAAKVWNPEVFVLYSTDKKSVIENLLNIRVNSTGHVHSFVPFTTETICPIDVKHFPFDVQECVLLFDTWPTNGDGVALHLTTTGYNLTVHDFYDSQEWMLTNYSLLYDGSLNRTNVVAMHLHIERQSFYYIFNLVIPSALIGIVSVVGFHLPSASVGGRLSKSRLGMMTLLSMSVLLLSVVNELPKFAFEAVPGKKGSFSSVPLIGIYYFSLLSIITLATITSSWIVVLEKQVIREGVPFYLRWLQYETWPCWKGRYDQRKMQTGKKNTHADYAPANAKVNARGGEAKKRGSVDTLELADLYEDSSNTPNVQQKQINSSVPLTDDSTRLSTTTAVRRTGDANDNAALMDMYKEIKSILQANLDVLRSMKAVMAEPLSQSAYVQAGLLVRRLEKCCLIIYLFLVFLVLMLFFCWKGWYA